MLYIVAAPDFNIDEVVIHAGSLLRDSAHPLHVHLLAYASLHGITLLPAAHVCQQGDYGLMGRVNGKICVLGSQSLMTQAHIDTSLLESDRRALQENGRGTYFLSIGDHLAGLLALPSKAPD